MHSPPFEGHVTILYRKRRRRDDKKEPERDENGIRQEPEIKQKRRKEAEESRNNRNIHINMTRQSKVMRVSGKANK